MGCLRLTALCILDTQLRTEFSVARFPVAALLASLERIELDFASASCQFRTSSTTVPKRRESWRNSRTDKAPCSGRNFELDVAPLSTDEQEK